VSPAAQSAGILVSRRRAAGLEVLLIHPSGPYWKNKDVHAWSIRIFTAEADIDAD
jgi:predicted NUDIX family NTP pyrophosphohydrolase